MTAISRAKERALAIHRALGNEAASAGVVSDLGDVALMRNQISVAGRYYAEALALSRIVRERVAFPSYSAALPG